MIWTREKKMSSIFKFIFVWGDSIFEMINKNNNLLIYYIWNSSKKKTIEKTKIY